MSTATSTYGRDQALATKGLLLGAIGLTLLLAVVTLRALASDEGLAAPLLVLGGIGCFLLLMRAPASALYVLLGAAIVSQEQGISFSVLDELGLFKDLQASLQLPALYVNPMELLAALTLVVCLLRAREGGLLRLYVGPLLVPSLMVAALLGWGLLHGIATGGDTKIALWGVRALSLLLLTSVLTANLVRRESQLRGIFLVATLGIIAKSAIALWRLIVEFNGSLGEAMDGATLTASTNSLVSHEDSFFFLLAVFLCVAAFAFGLPRREKTLSLTATLFAIVPLVANQRRASIAALLLAAVLCVIVLTYLGRLRPRTVMVALALSAVVLPVYAGMFWNSSSFVSMPLQAVKSGFEPDARDASSNKYRDIENENLRVTAKDSHYLGIGFGKQMTQVTTLPDISDVYRWYLYLPHNGLLWLVMTIGIPGLAGFMWLIWSAVRAHVLALRESESTALRATYLVGLMTIASYIVFVLLDQGIGSQRIGICLGLQLGLLGLAFEHREAVIRERVARSLSRKGESKREVRIVRPNMRREVHPADYR